MQAKNTNNHLEEDKVRNTQEAYGIKGKTVEKRHVKGKEKMAHNRKGKAHLPSAQPVAAYDLLL